MDDDVKNGRPSAVSGTVPYGPQQIPWNEQVPSGATISAPLDDPNSVYVPVPPADVVGDFPKIDYSMFEVPPTGLTDAERSAALAAFQEFIEVQHKNFSGFQGNQDQNYAGVFPYLLDMHANNIGDPFSSGRYTLNSKFCERAVLDWFAALWNVDWPHAGNPEAISNAERYWGYVLTMGFTEGNIYGLFNARDYLMGRTLLNDPPSSAELDDAASRGREIAAERMVYVEPIVGADDSPNAYSPVLFYSEDVHYSVTKAGRLLQLPTFQQVGESKYAGQCPITTDGSWPAQVPSSDLDDNNPASGTVVIADLEALVRFFVENGHPVVVIANLGTTWKGAYDDVPAINAMLTNLGAEYPWLWERRVQYGTSADGEPLYDTRRGFWLHVDGALGAAYLPFVEMAHNRGLIDASGPMFDFRNPAVMSVGCSMHKWLGGPWPSGVFMTRTGYQLVPPDEANTFLGTPDTTLGGSRSAFSPVILWDYISRMSYDDNITKALATESVAAYLEQRILGLEADLQENFGPDVDLWIARSKLSLTVRFRLVNETLNYAWSLDTDRLWVPISETERQMRSYSHVFVMHSVDEARVDELIDSIAAAASDNWNDAFPTIDASVNQPNPGPTVPFTPPSPPAGARTLTSVPRGWRSFARPH